MIQKDAAQVSIYFVPWLALFRQVQLPHTMGVDQFANTANTFSSGNGSNAILCNRQWYGMI